MKGKHYDKLLALYCSNDYGSNGTSMKKRKRNPFPLFYVSHYQFKLTYPISVHRQHLNSQTLP